MTPIDVPLRFHQDRVIRDDAERDGAGKAGEEVATAPVHRTGVVLVDPHDRGVDAAGP